MGLLPCLSPNLGYASPPEQFPLSNDAAIMGGAVLAGGQGAGSFWYNPALLARIHHSETEASAEVYGLRLTSVPRGVGLRLPNGTQVIEPLRRAQIVAVPTTFAGAFGITPKFTVGFGLYVPVASNLSVQADLVENPSSEGETSFQLRYRRDLQRYHAGLGFGWQPLPTIQFGVSVFAVYDQLRYEQRLFLTRSQALGQTESRLLDEDTTVDTFGVATNIGLRGQLHRLVHAAATVRTPTLVIYQGIDGSQTEAIVAQDFAHTDISAVDPAGWGQVQLSGWRIATGLAVGDPRWRVGVDVNAITRTRGDPLSRATFGARVGGEITVADPISLGGGVFFYSNDSDNTAFGIAQLHRWGGSFGVELLRRLTLNTSRHIEFRTVVALWYEGGRGTIGGLQVESVEDASVAQFTTVRTPAQTHLILLHIGSALSF